MHTSSRAALQPTHTQRLGEGGPREEVRFNKGQLTQEKSSKVGRWCQQLLIKSVEEK
jgi:hypothetical protein